MRFPGDNDHTRAGLLLLVVVVIHCAALEAWFQEGTNWSYVHQLLFNITFHTKDWVWPCMFQYGMQHFKSHFLPSIYKEYTSKAKINARLVFHCRYERVLVNCQENWYSRNARMGETLDSELKIL